MAVQGDDRNLLARCAALVFFNPRALLTLCASRFCVGVVQSPVQGAVLGTMLVCILLGSGSWWCCLVVFKVLF